MSLTSRGVTLRGWNEEVMLIKEWEQTEKGRWRQRLKSEEARRTKGRLSERKASLREKHGRRDERRGAESMCRALIYLYKKIMSEKFQGELVHTQAYPRTEIGYASPSK